MDKSLQTLNMLSMLYKPPDTNPLYIHIDPRWIRAALLSVILIASETTMEALYLMAGFYLQNSVVSRAKSVSLLYFLSQEAHKFIVQNIPNSTRKLLHGQYQCYPISFFFWLLLGENPPTSILH